MPSELPNCHTHLLFDASYAESSANSDLVVTITIEPSCEENRARKRFQTCHSCLDTDQAVTGFKRCNRIERRWKCVVVRQRLLSSGSHLAPCRIAQPVAGSCAQIRDRRGNRPRLGLPERRQSREDLLYDILRAIRGCAPGQEPDQARLFFAVQGLKIERGEAATIVVGKASIVVGKQA
jgi:hypothetical protein